MNYPQVEAAVGWWCDRLRAPVHHQLADPALTLVMTKVAAVTDAPTPEQVATFARVLTEKVTGFIALQEAHGGWRDGYLGAIFLSVDYHLDSRIGSAADEAGIPHIRLPLKTIMKVQRSSVKVLHGYVSTEETLWEAPRG